MLTAASTPSDTRPRADLARLLDEEGGPTLVLRFVTIHEALRRDARELAAAFAHAPDDSDDRMEAVRDLWRTFAATLRTHHAMEDQILFPPALALEPSLADVMRTLDEEHAALEPLLHAIEEAEPALASADAAARASAAAAELGVLLERHFAREEEHLLAVMRRFPPPSSGAPQPDPATLGWMLHDAPAAVVDAFTRTLSDGPRAELVGQCAAFASRSARAAAG